MPSPKYQSISLTKRAKEAVGELMECVDDQFTGNLTFDFSEGMVMLCRKTNVKRWPKNADPQTLDGGKRSR